jgi:hypothetical protein
VAILFHSEIEIPDVDEKEQHRDMEAIGLREPAEHSLTIAYLADYDGQ